jgi:hypothetical protein
MNPRGRYIPLSKNGFAFPPFPVPANGTPLVAMSLPEDTELLIFSRNGARRGLVAREMAYHHVAQGELAGEPYLVSF